MGKEIVRGSIQSWADNIRWALDIPNKPKLSPDVQNAVNAMRLAANLDEDNKPLSNNRTSELDLPKSP